jgi:uncharacterized protein (DUF488 family)
VAATVFTIGYERRSQSELVKELAQAGIVVLADVRELPLSRRRGFSKRGLSSAADEAGIAYVHLRSLGNPKAFRDAWKSGDAATGIAGYRAHLEGESRSDVDALAARVAQGGVCLLCVEHEAGNCHRSLLAEALRERLGALRVRNL